METVVSKFTVFFEEPFWVGIYEQQWENRYAVCKITFGAEPRDNEVYAFLLQNYNKLQFSQRAEIGIATQKHRNPKRMRREIERQMQSTGVGTKAQQAIQLAREQHKVERKTQTKAQRQAETERQFQLRQEKRKEKHKGH